MTDAMTPEKIAELEALDAARTQGEWRVDVWGVNTDRPRLAIVGDECAFQDDEVVAELPRVTNAGERDFPFIAAAANALPALLADWRRMREALVRILESDYDAIELSRGYTKYGLLDSRDNHGNYYQSASLADALRDARTLVGDVRTALGGTDEG